MAMAMGFSRNRFLCFLPFHDLIRRSCRNLNQIPRPRIITVLVKHSSAEAFGNIGSYFELRLRAKVDSRASVEQNVVGEAQSVSSASYAGGVFGINEDYGNYGDHAQNGSHFSSRPAMVDTENASRIHEKRRRKEISLEILEVKQDELIKNRPRQDQVKLTGIAFGPSYQPASSTKGKRSKLQNRKHQITSLFYDMKQK